MDFSILEDRLGVSFEERGLLKQALTHRSYLNENRNYPLGHNERLEFLGDAVLELVVREFLYRKFPSKPEGVLTAYRSALVNTQMLSALAVEIGLNDFLLLSRGEAKDTGRARQIILADAFEAVIGAVRLDQGYDAAQCFIATTLFHKLEEIVTKELWRDAKSRLQEVVQELLRVTPTYEVLEESGPDHGKSFVVGVYFGSDFIAQGTGPAKQHAEVEAAKAALALNGWATASAA